MSASSVSDTVGSWPLPVVSFSFLFLPDVSKGPLALGGSMPGSQHSLEAGQLQLRTPLPDHSKQRCLTPPTSPRTHWKFIIWKIRAMCMNSSKFLNHILQCCGPHGILLFYFRYPRLSHLTSPSPTTRPHRAVPSFRTPKSCSSCSKCRNLGVGLALSCELLEFSYRCSVVI